MGSWHPRNILTVEYFPNYGTSTLNVFGISNNNVSEEAADDIAIVLSHNTKLQKFSSNSFKTAGMIKIAKALKNVSNLTELSISDNSIDERAADDIATALSHNTKLQELHLHDNSFRTSGIVKIAKSSWRISSLTVYC